MWRDAKERHVELPKWAKHRKARPTNDFDSLKEEMYVRTRICHRMAWRVDDVWEKVLRSQLQSVGDTLHEFFALTEPRRTGDMVEEEEPTSKRVGLDHDDNGDENLSTINATSLRKLFMMMRPPQHYDPTIMPIALLNCPFDLLDRWAQMRCLAEFLKKDRVAVVNLCECFRHRQSLILSQEATRMIIMEEVLQQCLEQEPPQQQPFAGTSKKNAPVLRRFLKWAQTTISFDKVVICLDNVEMVLGINLLQLLSGLRSEDGIPVNVVLFCGPRETGLSFSSHNEGLSGLLIREFSLPSSVQLLDFVWRGLWMSPRSLPIILSPPIMSEISQSFFIHHNSVTRALINLKQVLALHFMQPGTSLLARTDEKVFNEEWGRIAALCMNQEVRDKINLLSKSSSWDQIHNVLFRYALAVKLIHRWSNEFELSTSVLIQWIGELASSRISSLTNTIISMVDEWEAAKLVVFLARLRNDFSSPAQLVLESTETIQFFKHVNLKLDFEDDERRGGLVMKLNELIILFDESTTKENIFRKELKILLRDVFYDVLFLNIDESSPLFLAAGSLPQTISPRPRQCVAMALRSCSLEKEVGESNVAGEIFSLIRDRFVVSAEELCETLLKLARVGDKHDNLIALFAIGSCQLLLCGLLREKSSTSNRAFEKTALVWCRIEG